MKRYILGWFIMVIGAIPYALLFASAIDSWVGSKPVKVYGTLLIIGGIVFVIGFTIREWGNKARKKVDSSDKGNQP